MTFNLGQDAFADALFHAGRPVPAGVTTARGQPDATRFAVYRNNVFVGLTKALSVRFPVTERLVGLEFFTGMARAYAQGHKPRSPLMFDYGDDFPDFIANFTPAARLAYLPDVARLEAAWTRAYHAADAVPLEPAALGSAAPEALPQLRLVPHPSASLIRSAHPAGSIWAANQHATVQPIAEWKPETFLVVRPQMAVSVHVLPGRDAGFAAALLAGGTLGEAARAALAATADFDFGAALLGLLTLGAFSAVNIDQGSLP